MISYLKRKLPHSLAVRKLYGKGKGLFAYAKNSQLLDGVELIGVTGTDGKTSTCSFLAQVFFGLGIPVAAMTSESHFLNGKWIENKTKRTTSSPFEIFDFLKKAKKEGVKVLILEVSSHALEQGRVYGLSFDYSVVTNLSTEHLDYHGSLTNYAKTKAKLLKVTKKAVILPRKIQEKEVFEKAISCEKIETFLGEGFLNKNIVVAKNLRHHDHGTEFDLHYKGETIQNIFLPVLGDYNVENLLPAVALETFFEREKVGLTLKEAIGKIQKVSGRLDELDFGQDFRIWISFAVTPQAIEKILKYAQQVKEDSGKVWIVYGATGGQHDKSKRPLMGETTGIFADFSLITDDETYGEDSSKIISEIELGILGTEGEYKVIQDRKEAIAFVLKNAKKGDVVVVTGMGNFNSRNVGGKEEEWNDGEVIKGILGTFN